MSHVEESGRWDANYHASLSAEIEQRINHPSASDIFVSDVAELSAERTDPRRWGTGTFEYIEISDVDAQTCMVHPKSVPCSEAPSRARKLVHAGDVLFSTVRPERRTVGVVREDQDGAVCTTGFAVLRPQKIDPMTLAYLLKSDFVIAQVLRCNIGIAYPAIDESCLLDVLIPVRQEDLALLNTHAEAILSLEKQIHSMREDFSKAVGQAIQSGLANPGPDSRPRQRKRL